MQRMEILRTLAREDMPVYRSERYDGSGFSLSLKDLAAEDAKSLQSIYERVDRVYTTWLAEGKPERSPTLEEALAQIDSDDLAAAGRALGAVTLEDEQTSRRISKAFHDLKSGALNGLVGYLQLLPMLEVEKRGTYIQKLVYLARDYAKIARNLVHDLDPEARREDEREQIHTVDHFLRNWQDFVFRQGAAERRVEVECLYEDGKVTNRCLETSTVDRVLYNLLGNAGRFSTDSIRLTVMAVGSHPLLRWVVENPIDDEQGRWLEEHVGEDLSPLFLGGLTRGGTGLGLRNCAEIVVEGFGLGSPREAVERGYLGARLIDSVYYSWFHWPSVVDEE